MKILKGLCLILTFAVAADVYAAETSVPKPEGVDSAKPGFPYVAEIEGKDVYVRAGAGMNYYRCGKISAPEQVIVVEEKLGWSMIRPPKGNFSWISKRYVDKDPQNPEVGVVKGDDVRVWAGSPYVPPIHSSSMQLKLYTGDTVKFFDASGSKDESDYYCIEPPKGAYLWINTAYTKKLGPLSMFTPGSSAPKPGETTEAVTEAGITEVTTIETPAVEGGEATTETVTTTTTTEAGTIETPAPKITLEEIEKLKEFQALSDAIDAELEKPLMQQDYSEIKTSLEKIAADEKAGKAAKYAAFKLEAVSRYMTAQKAASAVVSQDQELAKARSEIKSDLKEKLEAIPSNIKYDISGVIYKSAVYATSSTTKRFIIKDARGKIIAYATPKAVSFDSTKYVGKTVGLRGTIMPDPLSPMTLIEFNEIDILK